MKVDKTNLILGILILIFSISLPLGILQEYIKFSSVGGEIFVFFILFSLGFFLLLISFSKSEENE